MRYLSLLLVLLAGCELVQPKESKPEFIDYYEQQKQKERAGLQKQTRMKPC
jgi:hypothetical protein